MMDRNSSDRNAAGERADRNFMVNLHYHIIVIIIIIIIIIIIKYILGLYVGHTSTHRLSRWEYSNRDSHNRWQFNTNKYNTNSSRLFFLGFIFFANILQKEKHVNIFTYGNFVAFFSFFGISVRHS